MAKAIFFCCFIFKIKTVVFIKEYNSFLIDF